MPFLTILATINRNILLALKSVIDNFNRANTTDTLGSAPGQAWKIWRGGWRINSNKAEMTTTASDYPMATLTFLDEDVTVGVDGPSPGMGMSFWVSDAGNWWGAVYRQTYQCQTCSGCSAYNCETYNCNAYECGLFSYNCNVYSKNCLNPFIFYNAPVYTCNTNSFYTAPNYCCNITGGQNLKYNAPSCNITGGQNPRYNARNCFISRYTVNKAARYTCNTSNLFYTAPNYTCTSNAFYTAPNYTCSICGGQNLKYNTPTCNVSTPSNPGYNCSGFLIGCESPGNCTAFYCSSPGSCFGNCASTFFFQCNCVTTYKVDILQAVSNTITSIATSNFNAAIASFKSILSGSNITVKAFSGSGYNSQIGSDWAAVTNVNSSTKKKKHGILGSQSDHAQGNSIDEFRVEN